VPAILAVLSALVFAGLIAPRNRLAAFCIFWFLGNHLVEGSIIPLELVFEHRNYLPSMMLILLLVVTAHGAVASRPIRFGALCLVTALFSFWTYQRNFVWQDRVTFWSDSVRKAPDAARPHNNLAVALRKKGLFDEAIFHYKETIRLDPGFVEAYYNLGNTMMMTGRKNEAITYYQHAVRLNPGHVLLHLGLANALFDAYRLPEAKKHYLEALRLAPHAPPAHYELAAVLLETGRRDDAIAQFRAAARARPGWADPRNDLAWLLATDPGGSAAAREEAVALAESAAALSGQRDPMILDTLAVAYAAAGHPAAAETSLRALEVAREVQPDLVPKLEARSAAIGRGDLGAALREAEESEAGETDSARP